MDPFPAAVERLVAVHDPGPPPTVFPNRKVTRTGATPSPRGGIPSPAAGVSSPGGSTATPPAAAAGRPSGGAVPGRRAVHTAPPAASGTVGHTSSLPAGIHRLARTFWRLVATRTFPDLAGVAETDHHQDVLRKMRGA